MLHALEMEAEEEEDFTADDEDEDEDHHHHEVLQLLPSSKPAAASRIRKQGFGSHPRALTRRDSHGADNGPLGYGKMMVVTGTILCFWLLAYQVNNNSEGDASPLPVSPSTTQQGEGTPVDATPMTPTETSNSGGGTSRKATSTPVTKLSGPYSVISQITPDPEHLPLDEATKEALTEKWGKWHFWDGEEDNRPKDDYCGKYPNRDIPGDDFPEDSWQTDAVYVNHILDDGEQLISRTMEAIYTEYGWGKPQTPTGLVERLQLFRWELYDHLAEMPGPSPKYARRGDHGGGGWTTARSQEGLIRRILQ